METPENIAEILAGLSKAKDFCTEYKKKRNYAANIPAYLRDLNKEIKDHERIIANLQHTLDEKLAKRKVYEEAAPILAQYLLDNADRFEELEVAGSEEVQKLANKLAEAVKKNGTTS